MRELREAGSDAGNGGEQRRREESDGEVGRGKNWTEKNGEAERWENNAPKMGRSGKTPQTGRKYEGGKRCGKGREGGKKGFRNGKLKEKKPGGER